MSQDVADESSRLHVEQLRDSIKQEIRRELKIKEGAENLRKVSTDKRTIAQCQQAIKLSSQKLNDLHDHLQDLNAHISEEIVMTSDGEFQRSSINLGYHQGYDDT